MNARRIKIAIISGRRVPFDYISQSENFDIFLLDWFNIRVLALGRGDIHSMRGEVPRLIKKGPWYFWRTSDDASAGYR